jgi:hypothetical protein
LQLMLNTKANTRINIETEIFFFMTIFLSIVFVLKIENVKGAYIKCG